jgi:hypothetical protein
MQRFGSFRVVLLSLLIVAISIGAYVASSVQFQNTLAAALISFFVGANLTLLCVLTRVVLVERSQKWRSRLEKIPGVSFSIPVPEQLRQPAKAKERKIVDTAQTPLPQEEPFTLGTLAFEPPEPIVPSAPPVLDEKVSNRPSEVTKSTSIENAYSKAERPIKSQKQRQHEYFVAVCVKLKQENEEVAVWTEGELATLANSMLDETSELKDMIALLLPQRVVRININRTFEFEHHAQVLNNIVLATGQDLPVSFVNSTKESSAGGCVVNFEYNGKPVTWRFIEREDRLSDKFLKNALHWVSTRADGKFVSLSTSESLKTFVFVSNRISKQLRAPLISLS